MKRFIKKAGLMLCTLVVVFSLISVSMYAKEAYKNPSNRNEIKAVIVPNSVYFDNVPYHSGNGIPPRTKYFNKPLYQYGYYYYNGYLELTQYQSTGNGYLGLYSGYLNRGKKIR